MRDVSEARLCALWSVQCAEKGGSWRGTGRRESLELDLPVLPVTQNTFAIFPVCCQPNLTKGVSRTLSLVCPFPTASGRASFRRGPRRFQPWRLRVGGCCHKICALSTALARCESLVSAGVAERRGRASFGRYGGGASANLSCVCC